jgi:hypothetical protein
MRAVITAEGCHRAEPDGAQQRGSVSEPSRQAREWCNEAAVQIGSARVTGQDVFRALVARLVTDETLAHKIRADLADDLHNR